MYKFLRFIYETAVSYAATLVLLMAVSPAHAATFNLFSPATGILKGMTSTYVTTSASYSDIVALFSSCTSPSTKFLKADGTCGTSVSGTVTSVALTAPSVFSVSGSPVTSSGTLAISFAAGQTQNQVLASPNGASGAITLRSLVNADLANSAITINGTSTSLGGTRTLALASSDFANNGTTTTVLHGNASGNPSFAAVSLTADVSGTLAAGNGGLGITTTTDDSVPVGSGSAWQSKVLPSCADTGGNHLNYDISTNAFSCGTSGATSVANPTATIGLTAVNGSASSAMRSDGAPALSQAIVPTWTGAHTFSPNTTTTFNGVSNQWSTTVVGFGTTGQSYGSLVTAGTSSADETIRFRSAASGNRAYLTIRGDGVTSFGNSTDNPTYSFLGSGTTTFGGNALPSSGSVNLGSSSLRWGTTFTSAISDGTSSELLDSVSTTVRLSRGSAWTDLSLYTGGSARQTINSAGNVTINAPSSGTALTVNGVASGTAMRVNGVSANTYMTIDNVGGGENYIAANSLVALQTAGTSRLTINSSGAYGIGSGPSYGTSGQVLTSAGSGAAPTWGSTAANIISGGSVSTNGSGSCALTTNATVGLASCSVSTTVLTITFSNAAAHYWLCSVANEGTAQSYVLNSNRNSTTTSEIRALNLTSTSPITWSAVNLATTAATFAVTCQPL